MQSGAPESGPRAIRVSGALIATKGNDPDVGALGQGRCVRRPDDQAVGASQCHHKRGVLRGQGAHDPRSVRAPLRAGPDVVLTHPIGFDRLAKPN